LYTKSARLSSLGHLYTHTHAVLTTSQFISSQTRRQNCPS